MKLGIKITIRIISLVFIVVGVIIAIVMNKTSNLADYFTTEQALTANRAFSNAIDGYLEDAKNRAEMIAANDDIVDAVLARDSERLRKILISMGTDLDLITLCDINGIALARSHSDKAGDDVSNQKALSVALASGKGINAIESGSVVGLSTRGSAAIFDSAGNIIGAVTCGHDLSKTEYVDKMKQQSDCEITLFAGDKRMNTTIINEKGERVVGTKAMDEVIEAVLKKRETYIGQVELFGHIYKVCYTPLEVDNDVVGMLFSGVNIEDTLALESSMIKTIIIISILICIAAIGIIFEATYRIIIKPLRKIGDFAKRIEYGDIGISRDEKNTINLHTKDEIDDLARILENTGEALKGYIGEISDRMKAFAIGDFTKGSEYPFNGDFVVIKDSINHIYDSLNQTLLGINKASEQVAVGSKQCTDGAMLLSQGSTEQAASIEELSSAISEISNSVSKGSDMARSAAKLSNTIKKNAEKSSIEMEHMKQAAREINEANQNINKVIKVIDDIAFQTNILALNAAVEAARAGQMGKGFAVVADEVRSLAAKSADAVRDTGIIISTSIERAELGVKIADITAASLNEIISGINENADLVNNIANTYEEQNCAIDQINISIEQVSQVVQENSATAEQSAASSEELSQQSVSLNEMVGRFKLKGNSANYNPQISLSSKMPATHLPLLAENKY